MNVLAEAHKTFLIDLLQSGTEFMLIGGYAVNFHGYPRYTSDMDIWLKPDNQNKVHLVPFLQNKGFNKESIAHILELNFTIAQSFHIGQDETRIDFLTKISGVQFDEAWQQHVKLPLQNMQIPVIHYHHLIINKMCSNRLKDKADVEELQKINQHKSKP